MHGRPDAPAREASTILSSRGARPGVSEIEGARRTGEFTDLQDVGRNGREHATCLAFDDRGGLFQQIQR